MADDTINVGNINTATGAMNSLNDSIGDSLKEFKSFTKTVLDSGNEIDTTFKKVTRGIERLTKQIRPGAKELDKFGKVIETNEKRADSFGKAFSMALYTGNKQAMLVTSTLAFTARALATATRQVKLASDAVSDLSNEFKKAANDAKTAELAVSKLNEKQTELRNTIKSQLLAMRENKKAGIATTKEELLAIEQNRIGLAQVTGELRIQEDAYKAANASATKFEKKTLLAVEALRKEEEVLLEVAQSTDATAAAERQLNREMHKTAGGAKALSAAFSETMETKFFEYFKQASSLALVSSSAAMIVKALKQISDHAQTVNRIALSLGDTSEVGLGRLAKSGVEATQTFSKLTELSFELGYSMEELEGPVNKIRAGIRMDREGRLSEKAIQGLIKEAGYFARISGVELGASIDMLETRIKRYGMTAIEATANMQEMRLTLMQMTAGNKNNTIAMGDMVNIIEEASAASQSYIVDTRIMTQAIRAAVNQAENLGVAQKQAKDVAVGIGKIFSDAPDFIKIPAGFDLVHQLLGKNPEKLLAGLDKGARKQVLEIQSMLKAHKIGQYSASLALMDLIGATEAGMEAQSKQIEATILSGVDAAVNVKEFYKLENMATAVMVTKMMQDTVEMRKKIGKAEVTFSVAMAKDAAMLNDAIAKTQTADEDSVLALMANESLSRKEAEQKVLDTAAKNLDLKGLSRSQMKEYAAALAEGIKTAGEQQKIINAEKLKGSEANMKTIADAEKLKFDATVKRQTLLADKMIRPVAGIRKEVEALAGITGKPMELTQEGSLKLDKKVFESIKINNGKELADRIGINYGKLTKPLQKELETMVENGTTPEQLDKVRQAIIAASDVQKAAADATLNGTMSWAEKFAYWGTKVLTLMQVWGPAGAVILGLAGIGTAVALMWRGSAKNSLLIQTLMAPRGTIYSNVFTALQHSKLSDSSGVMQLSETPAKKGFFKSIMEFIKSPKGKWAMVIAGIALVAGLAYKLWPESAEDKKEKEETKAALAKTKAATVGGPEPSTPVEAPTAAIGATIAGISTLASKSVRNAIAASKATPKVGVVGTVLETGLAGLDVYQAVQEGQTGNQLKRTAMKASGKAIGGIAGTWGGAVAGGAMSVPLLGTGAIPGGIAGNIAGGQIGEWIMDKVADVILGPEMTKVTGTPTSMPAEPRAPGGARRPGGYAAMGGGGGGLSANIGLQSLTPDGALTLKIRGFQDTMAQINKANREMAT